MQIKFCLGTEDRRVFPQSAVDAVYFSWVERSCGCCLTFFYFFFTEEFCKTIDVCVQYRTALTDIL